MGGGILLLSHVPEAPMRRDAVIAQLRAHEADLHETGVARLWLFGSVSRDEAGPDSDVDLFFETDDPKFSLFDLVDVQDRVAEILGSESDVMTRDSLHPMIKNRIEAEALRVF
jgi:predicted nucleotidyltransferase